MRKGNPQKKMTYEDKFDRKYAWKEKTLAFVKRKNRKEFRRKIKQELQKEIY